MSTTRRLTTHRDRRRPTLLHSFAGLALAALLAGCGGGGGPMTSAPPDSTDPTDTGKPTDNERPTHVVQPTASTSAIEFTNTTAADLRDHWHAPAPVTDALGLEPVTDATNAATLTRIRARLTDADPAIAADWHAALAAGRATVLGTRDGYVVAKAAGGPAGHLDIRFDYAQAPAASAANRILLERAAKDWSRRIRDPFAGPPPATGPRSVEEVRVGRRDIDLLPNAMLIEVTMTDELVSRGGQIYIFTSPDDVSLAMPRLGEIELGRNTRDPMWSQHRASTISHEVGHALGFLPGPDELWAGIVDLDAHEWIGPAAMTVHGGPVPLQWWDPVDGPQRPVPPGTPGAIADPHHIGACESVLSYCYETAGPSNLDFAIMADIGFDIAPKAVGDAPELYGYGAWGEASGFAVTVERSLAYPDHDVVRARAGHGGTAPATALADAPLSGNATWEGFLLAVDTETTALVPVTGDAALGVDLATLAGEARFSELETHVDGTTTAFRHSSLAYAISVDGNTFADAQGRIGGGFYGANHAEAAGTLDDRTASILGAFGGTRNTDTADP